ncbi:MAG: 3-oxoacyl-[acyl-carrier-protein] synthase III C-terminal domain-containing protein [Thermoanaerobaculales bacterium]|nr:3-oxoacyl-[acyl-carrier-protein] synthase III C-terminal domain-containing protein [Thermoanaerobaculales bacterium]
MKTHRNTVIIGTGRAIPHVEVPNSRFLENTFFADDGKPVPPGTNAEIIDKFQKITDISERRYAEDHVLASDLATEAGAAAVEDAAIDPERLDYIVVAHNFGDVLTNNRRSDFVPSLAARVKRSLGIANPECIAYDLPFGCPGWVQAVIQADYFLRSGDAGLALIIGAETLSRVSDPHDRDSMIYSDGAGAAVLEARDSDRPAGVLAHAARSDTKDHGRLLWMGESYNPDVEDNRLFLKMYGRKLYNYALTTVPGVVKKSLDRAELDLTDVSKIFLHQANAKMDEAILRRLFDHYDAGPPDAEALMPMSISWLGNSSVATVPTLLDLVCKGDIEGHELNPGDIVVFASVGAGMNINSVVYRWV